MRDIIVSCNRLTSGMGAGSLHADLAGFAALRTWQINWRGAVSVAAFVLLWELLVRFGGGGSRASRRWLKF